MTRQRTNEAIDAQIHSDVRRLDLHARIDLDAFLALSSDERGARWRQWDSVAKQDLIIQALTRKYGDWSDEEVAARIAQYDRQWEVAALETDLTIPPAAQILAVVKDRYDAARRHDDFSGARQLDRVRLNLIRGARLAWSLGDLLVQSVNNPGAIYSTNRKGCTCRNGAAGQSSCWHVALYDLLLDMLSERADDDPPAAPPVDDGPRDTWGGFRAAATTYAITVIEQRRITLSERSVAAPSLRRCRGCGVLLHQGGTPQCYACLSRGPVYGVR